MEAKQRGKKKRWRGMKEDEGRGIDGTA